MIIEKEIEKKAGQVVNSKKKNMGDALGLEYLILSRKELKAKMPVNENTVQPFGILHGGASVALSETLCSIGAWFNLENPNKKAVGVEINANHIRPVPEGKSVICVSKPVRLGAKIQVWESKIYNESSKLVCMSRCTIAIVD